MTPALFFLVIHKSVIYADSQGHCYTQKDESRYSSVLHTTRKTHQHHKKRWIPSIIIISHLVCARRVTLSFALTWTPRALLTPEVYGVPWPSRNVASVWKGEERRCYFPPADDMKRSELVFAAVLPLRKRSLARLISLLAFTLKENVTRIQDAFFLRERIAFARACVCVIGIRKAWHFRMWFNYHVARAAVRGKTLSR